jgi:hypothetical protein
MNGFKMINLTLIWMLVLPIMLSALSLFVIPKVAKSIPLMHNIGFSVGGLIISGLIFAACFYGSIGYKTHDTEILNGEITSKERVHGTYEESYECNCRTEQSCSGSGSSRSCTSNRVCQTCYRTHYTVAWNANATIGSWKIDGLDELSSRVYQATDPVRYSIIQRGDAAAKEHSYTNYIKAVPQTLFRPLQDTLKTKYAGSIPAYPDSTYDFYKIDRVIGVGVSIPNNPAWNIQLSNMLKVLGPRKQANVVVVITKFADQDYFYALQDAWLNGKKNDVVVVIGAPDFPKKAAWVNVMALTDSDIIRVSIRDDILDLEDLTADNVLSVINKNVQANFKRKSMKDFAYLESEIDPPSWVIYSTLIADLLAYLGFWFFLFKQNSVYSGRRSSYNRFR